MEFREGYVYHIKDDYFAKVQDDKLMQNKEGGNYRPAFLCMEDRRVKGLLWVVPLSSRVAKFQALYDEKVARYGKCDTIVMGSFDGRRCAFLLQNMFPITEKYLDHIHTRNGNPVPVSALTALVVQANMQRLRQLIYAGKRVPVFPDIRRLEKLMLDELQADLGNAPDVSRPQTDPATIRQAVEERIFGQAKLSWQTDIDDSELGD